MGVEKLCRHFFPYAQSTGVNWGYDRMDIVPFEQQRIQSSTTKDDEKLVKLFRKIDILYSFIFNYSERVKNETTRETIIKKIKECGEELKLYPNYDDVIGGIYMSDKYKTFSFPDNLENLDIPFLTLANEKRLYRQSRYMSKILLNNIDKKNAISSCLRGLENNDLENLEWKKNVKQFSFVYEKKAKHDFTLTFSNTRNFLEIVDSLNQFQLKIMVDDRGFIYCKLAFLLFYKIGSGHKSVDVIMNFIITLASILNCNYIEVQDASTKKINYGDGTINWPIHKFSKYVYGRNYYTRFGFYKHKFEFSPTEEDVIEKVKDEMLTISRLQKTKVDENILKPPASNASTAYYIANCPDTFEAFIKFWAKVVFTQPIKTSFTLSSDYRREQVINFNFYGLRDTLEDLETEVNKMEEKQDLKNSIFYLTLLKGDDTELSFVQPIFTDEKITSFQKTIRHKSIKEIDEAMLVELDNIEKGDNVEPTPKKLKLNYFLKEINTNSCA
jgi:hypothetical protein